MSTNDEAHPSLAAIRAHTSLENLYAVAMRKNREADAEIERLQRLLDHATQDNPGTSTLVMLMNEVEQAKAGRDEAVRAALANSDACWRLEQEVLERQRDEARAEVERLRASRLPDVEYARLDAMWQELVRERDSAKAEVSRLNAQLESVAAENHARAQRESVSLEDWKKLREENDQLRYERRMFRRRIAECLPWVGCAPYPNTPGFTEMIACRDLAQDTLDEVPE